MPRLLIVSNGALSKNDSNGRTLMNFLGAFSPEDIAQFCIHGTVDETCCKYIYQVSDREALAAVKHFGGINKKQGDSPSESKSVESAPPKPSEPIKRNTRNMVLRDIIWRTYLWWNRDFDAFLEGFRPDAVLLQAGDCPFMYYIARKVAKKYSLPLMMYNSEGYVLKKLLYNSSKAKDIWHNILKKRLENAYKKFMSKVDFCFYISEYLEKCYQEKYPHPGKSCAIYTSSSVEPLEDKSGKPFQIAYCGNLGVGRVEPLCDLAEVLYEADSTAALHIYGTFVTSEDEAKMTAYPNVRFHGRVPYEEIPEIMSKANLLLHCENKNRLSNLIHAFSTKIADSLACGRPFLVYADEAYPFVEYLRKHDAAHIAGTREELKEMLCKLINDPVFLYSHVPAALRLAAENHNMETNSRKFFRIANELCDKEQVQNI